MSLKFECLLKSPGLSSVFELTLIMLLFGGSLHVFLFPSPPVPVSILLWLYQEHRLQFVSPSLSCFTVFWIPEQGPSTYLSFRFIAILFCGQPGRQSPQFGKISLSPFFFFFFCLLWLGLVVRPRLGDLFVYQNPRGVCASHFPGRFWVVHILFVRMVKFQYIAQFPVDHLAHPVMSSLLLFLSWFAAFAYHTIDCFVSSSFTLI